MKGYRVACIISLFCFLVTTIAAQNREQMEEERMQVIKSIEATDELIANSESDRQKGIATLVALRGQIAQRNALLDNIKKSISSAELEIENNILTIENLTHRVSSIENQYATILRSKYVRRLTGSKWITILSASNINEAFLRWNYYRQFDAYRKSKLEELQSIKDVIAKKNEEIKNYALENSSLIQEQQRQNSELQERIEQQNKLIIDLQKDKTILQSQLTVIKEAREKLNQAIESKVLNELTWEKISSDKSKSEDSEALIVKGEVIIPITDGYVIDFSIDGIDSSKTLSFSAGKEGKVISIAAGKVVSVKAVKGYGQMIIVQHNDYYSIYANLDEVYVAEDEKIDQRTELGSVDTKENTLHFELWKEKVRMNAKEWLAM